MIPATAAAAERQFDVYLASPVARVELASHRTLDLRNGSVAMLADQSTGWCLLNREGYATLVARFAAPGQRLSLVDPAMRPVLRRLWDSGLLLIDGMPHPDSRPQEERYPSSLLLKLTGACNLECTYCYDYDTRRFRARLGLDRVGETLRALLSKRRHLSLVFHGGEPLLRFDLIKDIVDLSLRIAQDRSRLSFSIQTNGSLFSTEIVTFLERYAFSVGISLDGFEEDANRLRPYHSGRSSLAQVVSFLDAHPQFVRERCGFLAVVSRASASRIPAFAQWLQDRGIRSLTFSFLDLAGRGSDLDSQKLSPDDAVALYAELIKMVRTGDIRELALRGLISRIENLFTFQPRDFCHKGPCAAASEFLVLDAEGAYRSCDCVYDPFFELGTRTEQLVAIGRAPARRAVQERHEWLRDHGADCSNCPLFGLCGGTCVAKAIATHGTPNAVDPVECAVVKYIYPVLLEEFDQPGAKPLLDYYHRHRLPHLPAVS